MESRAYAASARPFASFTALAEAVAANPDAIGYVGMNLIAHPGLHPLSINGIPPQRRHRPRRPVSLRGNHLALHREPNPPIRRPNASSNSSAPRLGRTSWNPSASCPPILAPIGANKLFFLVFQILGGLALFIFGMNIMSRRPARSRRPEAPHRALRHDHPQAVGHRAGHPHRHPRPQQRHHRHGRRLHQRRADVPGPIHPGHSGREHRHHALHAGHLVQPGQVCALRRHLRLHRQHGRQESEGQEDRPLRHGLRPAVPRHEPDERRHQALSRPAAADHGLHQRRNDPRADPRHPDGHAAHVDHPEQRRHDRHGLRAGAGRRAHQRRADHAHHPRRAHRHLRHGPAGQHRHQHERQAFRLRPPDLQHLQRHPRLPAEGPARRVPGLDVARQRPAPIRQPAHRR